MKKTESINCDIPVYSLEYWKGKDFWLKPKTTYTLVIDYPFSYPGRFEVKTSKNGMGLVELLSHVYKGYEKMYADPEQGWFHGIEDLVIEAIKINHAKKKITLGIGS